MRFFGGVCVSGVFHPPKQASKHISTYNNACNAPFRGGVVRQQRLQRLVAPRHVRRGGDGAGEGACVGRRGQAWVGGCGWVRIGTVIFIVGVGWIGLT